MQRQRGAELDRADTKRCRQAANQLEIELKGIVQPFELGGVTRLIQSAVKFCIAGNLKKKFLMVQSRERSLKLICAA